MILLLKYGAPEEIRTPDPLVRSQVLYPAELRARKRALYLKLAFFPAKYFTLLKTRVLEAIEAGITADEISKVVTMDDFKDVAMFDELNSRNVFDAFRELEFYDEE